MIPLLLNLIAEPTCLSAIRRKEQRVKILLNNIYSQFIYFRRKLKVILVWLFCREIVYK